MLDVLCPEVVAVVDDIVLVGRAHLQAEVPFAAGLQGSNSHLVAGVDTHVEPIRMIKLVKAR